MPVGWGKMALHATSGPAGAHCPWDITKGPCSWTEDQGRGGCIRRADNDTPVGTDWRFRGRTRGVPPPDSGIEVDRCDLVVPCDEGRWGVPWGSPGPAPRPCAAPRPRTRTHALTHHQQHRRLRPMWTPGATGNAQRCGSPRAQPMGHKTNKTATGGTGCGCRTGVLGWSRAD